jgi:hypothetical protein
LSYIYNLVGGDSGLGYTKNHLIFVASEGSENLSGMCMHRAVVIDWGPESSAKDSGRADDLAQIYTKQINNIKSGIWKKTWHVSNTLPISQLQAVGISVIF